MYSIVVCVKIIPDPEMPFSIFKVDKENKRPIPPSGTPPVISPFDENALEAALRIKDRHESKVTVLSLGKAIPRAILQKALAMGTDEAIVIEDPEFESLDPFSTADALASAIKKIGRYDLVFAGRQAGDWDAGIVWAGMAELLNLPSITIAFKAEIDHGKVIAERCVSDGIEVLESEMPALITFSSEVGESRYVSLQALMKAKKQKIIAWSASDLDVRKRRVMEMRDLYEPDLGLIECTLVPGDTPEERGRNLAKKLVSEGLLHGQL
jgi:electron transfer flavoprotein beta subunit